MEEQKDRYIKTTGEANHNKSTNFSEEENGDTYPADKDDAGDNNDLFTDDDNRLQTKEEYEEATSNHQSQKEQKVTPPEPDTTPTLGDKITVDDNNEDILTPVKDKNSNSFAKDADEAY